MYCSTGRCSTVCTVAAPRPVRSTLTVRCGPVAVTGTCAKRVRQSSSSRRATLLSNMPAGHRGAFVLLTVAVAPVASFLMSSPIHHLHGAKTSAHLHGGVRTGVQLMVMSDAEMVAAAPMTAPAAQPEWLGKVNKVSTFASILCAIDCTVFPILLALLPLAGFAPAGLAEVIHRAAHAVAIWFVAPVGGSAVLSNWLQHKDWRVGLWGACGVALVLLANVHLPHVILGWHVPHTLGHALHDNHRAVNVFGCVLLLSSQRYAHNLLEKMGKCCGHNHDAGHDHSHAASSHDHSHADGGSCGDPACNDPSHDHSHAASSHDHSHADGGSS